MKTIFTGVLILFCFTEVKPQAIAFRTTYPDITITSVSQTADHGYIVSGYSTVYTTGSKDIVLIKTDSMGTVTWTKTFGNSVNTGADDIAANAVEIPGGTGYYLAGQFWNQTNNTYEVYALKTDANGNRLWSKTMYNGGYDKGMRVDNAPGGGCFVTGWLGNSSRGYVCHIDANGNVLWQNSVYYAAGAWVLSSGRPTSDGGTIACGYDNELGSYEMWLVKMSSAGGMLWNKGYAMSATYNFSYDVCSTNDGGYMLAGGSSGLNIAKVDSSGNLQWAKTYSGISASPRAYSLKQCQDLGYIFLSNDLSNNQYLMKTDTGGNVMWTMQYTGGYFINTVEQTADGGYVLAMGTDLIKTDANGVTGCGEVPFTLNASPLTLVARTPSAIGHFVTLNAVAADSSTSPSITPTICFPTAIGANESPSSVTVFPNPVRDEFTIYDLRFTISKIEIYNTLGSCIFSQQLKASSQKKQLTLDISSFAPGLYFLKLLSSNGMTVSRFVKQ